MTDTPIPMNWRGRLTSIGLGVVILFVGGGVFALLYATTPDSGRDEGPAPPRKVRVFESHPGTHIVAVTSYGQSQAADDWTAKAEVEGNLKEVLDEFEDGHVVAAGERLVLIDDEDLKFDLLQAEVQITAEEAAVEELDQRLANVREVLEIRKPQLAASQREFERSEKQLNDGLITVAVHERIESGYRDRLAAVRELENEVRLIPKQIATRRAALAAAELKRDDIQRDIDDCEITMPFTGLCIGKEVDLHEKVERGQALGTFISLDKAEVLAMVEPRKAFMLFPNAKHEFYGSINLKNVSFNEEMRKRLEKFVVLADVTWRVGERRAQWRGRATRISAVVDERSRTAPAVIEVEDAFTDIRPGVRPALVPGMFLEVTLYGDTLEDVHVIPRDALREGNVYLERDGKLVVQPVHVLALEDEVAVIDKGLKDGDRVVLTDLFPAATGMNVAAEVVDSPVTHRSELPEPVSDLSPAD